MSYNTITVYKFTHPSNICLDCGEITTDCYLELCGTKLPNGMYDNGCFVNLCTGILGKCCGPCGKCFGCVVCCPVDIGIYCVYCIPTGICYNVGKCVSYTFGKYCDLRSYNCCNKCYNKHKVSPQAVPQEVHSAPPRQQMM